MTKCASSSVSPPLHFFSVTPFLRAGSATWNLNPTSGDWDTANNRTPATGPNGFTDIATFDTSTQTAISFSQSFVKLDSLIFDSTASAYTFTLAASQGWTFSGAGIGNNAF